MPFQPQEYVLVVGTAARAPLRYQVSGEGWGPFSLQFWQHTGTELGGDARRGTRRQRTGAVPRGWQCRDNGGMVRWRGLLGKGPSGRPVSVRDSWLRVEARNCRHRGTPDSDSSMPPRHPRGHGGCASPCPRRAYPTTSITHPSLEDGGQIEVLLEKPTTNTPIQQRTPALEFVDGGNDVVTMSFTYLDPTRYSISLSLHSLIVAVGCSHRIQWHEPEQGNCQGDRLCCLERRRNVVNLDELRLGQTVEPRGVPGTVHRGGRAIRDRNAWAEYRRRLPDTPLTQRAGMHDQFQLLPHIGGH